MVSPTPELDRHWLSWLSQHQDKQAIANQARDMILSLDFKAYRPGPEAKKRILEQVKLAGRPPARTMLRKREWLRVAAVLLLVVGTVLALSYFNNAGLQREGFTMADSSGKVLRQSNAPGERTQHILPDGSTVDLNAGSSLEYPETFGTAVRVVKLEGEAFFKAAHDSNWPFKVVTENFEVVVLGTQFNVNTKPNASSVALIDGKVRLDANASNASMELSPNQMALFDEERSSFTSAPFDPRYVTGWKDGYLVFKEASFSEVVEQLHSWYGVDIAVLNTPASSDWSYTASFKQESLENVLLNMSLLRSFEYQIKRDSLILSFQ